MFDWKYLIALSVAVLTSIVLVVQIRRLWQMRYILRRYLQELKTLNANLERIIHFVNDKANRPAKTPDTVCQNCYFRMTYVTAESPGEFVYRCRLDQRAITLSDTCKRFQRDFQNTRI